MITDTVYIRVRYEETDKMSYVYYGNYARFYEVARTELIRKVGMSYKEIEELGYIMPVRAIESKYFKSAQYDDELRVETTVKEKPAVRIDFEHKIYNQKNELIHIGYVHLVFADEKTKKPCRPPKKFVELIEPYFNNKK